MGRVHFVRLLYDFLSILLVERGQVFGPRGVDASLSLDGRLPRSEDGRAHAETTRSLLRLSMPHDPQLHQNLPERTESGRGHRRHQEADGRRQGTQSGKSPMRYIIGLDNPASDLVDSYRFIPF